MKNEKWRRFVGDAHCLYSVILNLEFPVLHATSRNNTLTLCFSCSNLLDTKYLSCFKQKKHSTSTNNYLCKKRKSNIRTKHFSFIKKIVMLFTELKNVHS